VTYLPETAEFIKSCAVFKKRKSVMGIKMDHLDKILSWRNLSTCSCIQMH